MTVDQLQHSLGFRIVDQIIKKMKQVASNLTISTADGEPILDIGESTTIDRLKRNTTPLPLPNLPGSIIHTDIIFGSGTAIRGAKYALFLVDQSTRHKYIYPLQNLKKDILPAFIKFFSDINTVPQLIRTDFDHKLMDKAIENHLLVNKCRLQSALPEQQSMNGPCERKWRSLLRMSRSWLASAILPANFWWFALKRATGVSNYLLIRINGNLTSPHKLMYNSKPDYRNLFPMFLVS